MIDYNKGLFICRIRVNKRPVLTITHLNLKSYHMPNLSVGYTNSGKMYR